MSMYSVRGKQNWILFCFSLWSDFHLTGVTPSSFFGWLCPKRHRNAQFPSSVLFVKKIMSNVYIYINKTMNIPFHMNKLLQESWTGSTEGGDTLPSPSEPTTLVFFFLAIKLQTANWENTMPSSQLKSVTSINMT